MKNSVRLSVALAFGLGATLPPFAFAQQAAAPEQVLEKVEITGSIIKRIEAEGALPVQVITRAQIDKLGVQTANELVQQLPAMQGFTAEAASMNGGGGGIATASIHDLGTAYTLVLLNGQRIAPATTGTTINLETLPLSAIERVEVLTDGASALYGSDAIAGVVNFITKKNSTDGSFNITFDRPVHTNGAGSSSTFSISKGFGDLDRDGFNVIATLAHDEQTELKSNQRSFSKSGLIPFTSNGQALTFYQTSINSIPANLTLIYGDATQLTNPNYAGPYAATFSFTKALNGTCGNSPGVFAKGAQCRFDYGSQQEDVAPARRTSAYIDSHFKINESLTAFADVVFSQYDDVPRYAPNAQGINLYLSPAWASFIGATARTTPSYNNDVLPAINAGSLTTLVSALSGGPAITGPTVLEADINLRTFDAGGRTDDYRTTTEHFATGLEGKAGGFDYRAVWVHSYTGWEDIAKGGYLDSIKFNNLIANGQFDPLLSQAGTGTALGSAISYDRLDWQRSFLDTLQLQGSHDLFTLPGGSSELGFGAEYDHVRQTDDPPGFSQGAWAGNPNQVDSVIGGPSGLRPYTARRSNYGAFAELLLPIVKQLEVTGSLRYDDYQKVHNSYSIDANGNPAGAADQGVTSSKTTYKIAFRFTPIKEILVRGSYGTGFRAPRVFDIANPLSFAGNTAGTYLCPFAPTDPLARGCIPNNNNGQQFDIVAGGNPLSAPSASGITPLKPEKSKQSTIGVRFEPISSLSIGADLWNVKIDDKILTGGVPETVAFANPDTYRYLFNVIIDPIQLSPVLALTQTPTNATKAEYEGVDFDLSYGLNTGVGRVSGALSGTHLIKSRYTLPPSNAVWLTSLGTYGPDQEVAFRNVARFQLSLSRENYTHTITANYKSGYKDQSYTAGSGIIRTLNANGSIGGGVDFAGLDVPSYTLWDWQTVYHATKAVDLTLGVKNIFDTRPPMSFVTAGSGNQVGYDGRYADPLLRQVYARVKYSF